MPTIQTAHKVRNRLLGSSFSTTSMRMMVAVMALTLSHVLQVLLKGGQGLLGPGEVSRLYGALEGIEVGLQRAGCGSLLAPTDPRHILTLPSCAVLLERRKGLLCAWQILRLQGIRKALKVLLMLLEATVHGGSIRVTGRRNTTDGHRDSFLSVQEAFPKTSGPIPYRPLRRKT